MKVYIFGAGASRAAQGETYTGLKSPLVNDLFNSEYQDYAEQMGLSHDELAEFKTSFELTENKSLENWLTDRWDKISTLKTPQTAHAEEKLFGRLTFYIWWLMMQISNQHQGKNLYNAFLRKLIKSDEHFGFINFNYDTLLDKAYQKMGASFVSGNHNLNTYIDNNYIKPHGSINWFLQRRGGENLPIDPMTTAPNIRYQHAAGQMFKDRNPINMSSMRIYDPEHPNLNEYNIISSSEFNRQFFYPLILLPLSSKLYGQIEGFKEAMIDSARDIVSKATDVYFVGYRAEDEVIKNILKLVKPNTQLHIIGRESAFEIKDRIIKIQPNFKVGKIYTEGFEYFINNDM